MNDRRLAVTCVKYLLQGAFLQNVLEKQVYGEASGVPENRDFVIFLVRGTAERTVLLSAVLSRVLTRPADHMRKDLLAVLLTGAFELIYGHAPAYAVVSAYVELAGALRMKGLANAVLRRIDREKESILGSLTEAEKLSFSSEVYAIFSERFGEAKTREIGEWFLSPESKALGLRVNTSKVRLEDFEKALTEAEIPFEPTGVTPDTYFVRVPGRIAALPGFSDGWFYLESPGAAASIASVRDELLAKKDAVSVLDACASPGGKTIQIADILALRRAEDSGRKDAFLAADRSEKKCAELMKNVRSAGFQDYLTVRVRNAEAPEGEAPETYDLINLDVPCSGLGVLSGKPEGKERITKTDIQKLSEIQKRILEANAPLVKPGGLLLYSTCTVTGEENGGQIRSFLTAHPEFTLLSEKQFLPGDQNADGFYFAGMKKNAGCTRTHN